RSGGVHSRARVDRDRYAARHRDREGRRLRLRLPAGRGQRGLPVAQAPALRGLSAGLLRSVLGSGLRPVLGWPAGDRGAPATAATAEEVIKHKNAGCMPAFLCSPSPSRSTGWPMQAPASQQVDMQMEHRLPAILVAIDHGAIPLFGEALLLGVIRRRQQQLAEQLGLVRGDIVQRGQRLLRDEQHMHGSLRIEVAERQYIIVLVNDVGGNLATDDLAEDGFAHCCSRGNPMTMIQSSDCLPPNACASVLRSTYSSSPPRGTPYASRVGRTPPARANWAR